MVDLIQNYKKSFEFSITRNILLLSLLGIDDDEIDGYILNEVEVTVKTRMWLVGNAEHLAAMERRFVIFVTFFIWGVMGK